MTNPEHQRNRSRRAECSGLTRPRKRPSAFRWAGACLRLRYAYAVARARRAAPISTAAGRCFDLRDRRSEGRTSSQGSTGHRSKRFAHGAIVFEKGHGAARPMACEDDVHGASHADGALEFATVAPHGATVLGSHELGMNIMGEK